ncbi:MAG: GNAT family N-acetyltransferase [Dehalococcoidia bacterium]|nr:GNAT family N-acetyltransferase [Dehalococcoidia bacterium]
MTPEERVRHGLDVLYATDAAGRLLHPRNPRLPAPRLHFVRTATGNTWRFAASLSPALVARIEPLLAAEPVEVDTARWEAHEPACLVAVRDVLALDQSLAREYRGPAFAFPERMPPSSIAVEVLAEPSGVVALPPLEWVTSAVESDQPLVVARDGEGRVVAQCHSARRSASAAHAGVETAPEARQRGLGAAVVTEWAVGVRRLGLEPYYGTWWDNAASRALAARLGLTMFAEDWHVD